MLEIFNNGTQQQELGQSNAIQRHKVEHAENSDSLDFLEAGCKVTCVNEVNGHSVSETSLMHPQGIQVTNEVSVSVASSNNNNAITDNRSQRF
jgi:hypothetical protein